MAQQKDPFRPQPPRWPASERRPAAAELNDVAALAADQHGGLSGKILVS